MKTLVLNNNDLRFENTKREGNVLLVIKLQILLSAEENVVWRKIQLLTFQILKAKENLNKRFAQSPREIIWKKLVCSPTKLMSYTEKWNWEVGKFGEMAMHS